MTAPVINRNNGSDWLVSFFVPSSFQSYSDVPKSDVVQIITARYDTAQNTQNQQTSLRRVIHGGPDVE